MKEFVVGYKLNDRFSHLVALNFTVEGTGAAVILGAYFFKSVCCMSAGLILVALGALALLMDLGKPANLWRTVLKPGESWISRGAIFLIGLFLLSLPYAAVEPLRFSKASIFFELGGASFSILLMLYTGFLLSTLKSIPFWNTRIMPALFLSQSAASGLLILHCLMSFFQPELAAKFNFYLAEMVLLTLSGGIIGAHLKNLPPKRGAAHESFRRLINGELKNVFWGGGMGLGFVLPAGIILIAHLTVRDSAGISLWLAVGSVFRIIGDFLLRTAYLNSGIYESILD